MSTVADITFQDNADFRWAFQFTDKSDVPYDFTGSTFKMDIKQSADAAAIDYSMTTAGGEIVSTDLSEGKIQLVIEKGSLDPGAYVYDLIRVNGTAEEALLSGSVRVTDGVTA